MKSEPRQALNLAGFFAITCAWRLAVVARATNPLHEVSRHKSVGYTQDMQEAADSADETKQVDFAFIIVLRQAVRQRRNPNMELVERFQKYAEDFEKTYVDDDWSRIAPYFAEDAVYVVRDMPIFLTDAKGRDAVLAALKDSINGFDRRCASRSIEFTAPLSVAGQTVTIHWRGTYTQSGAPNLEFAGIEEAQYNEAAEIVRLADIYESEAIQVVSQWMEEHGDKLKDE